MAYEESDNTDERQATYFDVKTLDDTISKFIDYVKDKDAPKMYNRLNFREGWLKSQEEYKRRIQERAKSNLSWHEWQLSDVGSGVIADFFLYAVDPKTEKENNLVDNRFTMPFFRRKLRDSSTYSSVEKVLFDIYHSEGEESEEIAFINATKIFGRKYDLISFLFFVKNPERYLPVKPTFFDESFEALNLLIDYKAEGNCSWQNYNTFIDIIRYLRDHLSERIFDISLLDAHSFAWIVRQNNFRTWNSSIPKHSIDSISVEPFMLKATKHKISLKGQRITSSQRAREDWCNKNIGDEGERFIFKREEEIVRGYNIGKEPEWKSQTEGDGLGYDILSYDENGNEIYIEVKTTKGNAENTIYITANELEKSITDADSYRLYRVYNFDLDAGFGNILIRHGSLKDLCISAQKYIVDFGER